MLTKKMTRYQSKGFTLIEIIVALFIFAILGTIAAIGLRAVIRTHKHLEKVDKNISQLEIAMTLMRRDLTQMTDRAITNTSGEELPALMVINNHHIEFTTGGYANPFAASKRGTLQRVAYQLKNNKLVRLTWSAIDRPAHIEPSRRVMLNGVTHMNLSFFDNQKQIINVWTPDANVGTLPQAIIFTLKLRNHSTLQGVFPIVGRGFNER
jgi:general secretion pathway protein J